MPTNDHLQPDPGFRADPGFMTVDLADLPPSLRDERHQSKASVGDPMFAVEPSQQLFPLPADTAAPAVDPALIAGLVAAIQNAQQTAPPSMDSGVPSPTLAPVAPAWGAAPGALGGPLATEIPPSYAAAPAPRVPGTFSGEMVIPARIDNPDEQVVARLPVEIDLTHSDGRVYLEVLVPYEQARLLSIAASRCLIVTVGVEDELLYLATDGVGATTLTGVNAPAFDEVLLTEGDRIGILVRFPSALGLVTGAYVDVTMYVGAAPHVTVK